MSLATYDQQAAADMAAFRKRSGFTIGAHPVGRQVKSVVARCRVLRAALSGPMPLAQFALAAGYSGGAAAAQMVYGLAGDGLLSVAKVPATASRQPRVMISITDAGREWLAKNGGEV